FRFGSDCNRKKSVRMISAADGKGACRLWAVGYSTSQQVQANSDLARSWGNVANSEVIRISGNCRVAGYPPKMTHSIHYMRDPTRGGFSSAVNEIAAQSRVRIPIATPARALACDCFREEALLTQLPHAPPLATSRAATPVEPQEKHRSRTS
ncbi:MAG: hypothetical protein JOZ29_15070, partial [Deltaproteobacteria bacterium]|nr:hypothetical protein [Deltaproteobacteria bacterium]